MKTFLTLASSLALCVLLLTAQAQTPQDNPSPAAPPAKTADQRAATNKWPKAVQDSKALGRKMVQKSKPTDMRVPPPAPAQKK